MLIICLAFIVIAGIGMVYIHRINETLQTLKYDLQEYTEKKDENTRKFISDQKKEWGNVLSHRGREYSKEMFACVSCARALGDQLSELIDRKKGSTPVKKPANGSTPVKKPAKSKVSK